MAACKTQMWCVKCGTESRSRICSTCQDEQRKWEEEQAQLAEDIRLDMEMGIVDDESLYDALEEMPEPEDENPFERNYHPDGFGFYTEW